MRCTLLLAIGLSLVGVCAGDGAARAADDGAYGGRPHAKRHRPLEVTVYRRHRVGGYSYGTHNTLGTYGRTPPPYEDVRQSPGGPFDSGFFFDSAIGPHGGESPYLH